MSAPALGSDRPWRYGLMGLPLAFVALPLYIYLPHHYAATLGVHLGALGALLLAARLADALIDPLLGRWTDRLYRRGYRAVLRWAALACGVLGVGLYGLLFPAVRGTADLLVWAAAFLVLTYTAYSFLGICHQSWGAMLGGDERMRSRIVAWREGFGLVGLVLASIIPVALGMSALVAIFLIALVLAWWAWNLAPRPLVHAAAAAPSSLWLPFGRSGFRPLLAVFMVNGIASAMPATLMVFFVQDRIQAPASDQPLFLGSYFVAAALMLPLWLRGVARFGLAQTWLLGMALSVLVFIAAATLGAGDRLAFGLVCALSGAALGVDLAIPSAMLAGVIGSHQDRGHAEGAYFGWWNFATKLNLALAAGLALPALDWLGYSPGTRDLAALQTLTWAYCVLPCILKTLAASVLYFFIVRRTP